MKKFIAIAALVALCVIASDASAVCGGRGNNIGRINNLQQRVIGNQLITFDRFGNVVRRQFINAGGLNVNIGGRSLQDRLLFGF